MSSGASPSGPSDFWDQRYAGDELAFGALPNEFLTSQQSRLKTGMRALLPGDGEGRNGVWLAERGLVVTSVDASGVAVAKALKLAASRGVTITALQADLTTWTWPEASFDLLASIYVHWKPDVRRLLHRRMLSALVPGGLIILEAYTTGQIAHRAAGSIGGPQDPEMLMSAEIVKGDFAGCEILELAEAETVLAEGRRHTGASSVVRFVGRKR